MKGNCEIVSAKAAMSVIMQPTKSCSWIHKYLFQLCRNTLHRQALIHGNKWAHTPGLKGSQAAGEIWGTIDKCYWPHNPLILLQTNCKQHCWTAVLEKCTYRWLLNSSASFPITSSHLWNCDWRHLWARSRGDCKAAKLWDLATLLFVYLLGPFVSTEYI